MYISQNDITKRAKPLSKFKDYRDPLVVLNATKKKDFKSLERLLNEWNYSTDDDKVSYIRTIEIVSEGFNHLSLKEQDSIVSILKEYIIPKLDHQTTLEGVNILKSRTSLNESQYEILKEETIKNKQCSRILKNVNNLDKELQIKEYIEESTNNIDVESPILCIEELCSRINSISSFGINEKYSIALESVLYNMKRYMPGINSSDVVYAITEYFLAEGAIIDELESIAKRNKLYTEDEIDVALESFKNVADKVTIISEGEKIVTKSANKIRDIIDILKSSSEKTIESLKEAMRKIYTKPKEDVINETPFILGSIRKFFIVGGTLAINPVLGIITGLTDYFIEQEINRPQADKYIKQLEREIKTTERKISEAKKDSTIERLNDYKDKLESQKNRAEDYKDKLYSDAEKYKDDDEDISFEEAAGMILTIEYIMEHSNEEHIRDFDDIILSEATKDKDDEKEPKKNVVDKVKSKVNKSIDNTKKKVDKSIKDTKKKGIATLTGVKLAMESLKKKGKDLTTKERQVSQNLDMLMNKYVQNVEDSVTLKSREAVIKGQVLPSASKIIKIALTATAAFAINPAVAVIGSLGAIGVAKTANKKERQLILDELDTHLKIVERKISQAESDGDNKQLEQLYKLQTRLTHERNRIKYKMKATQYQGLY